MHRPQLVPLLSLLALTGAATRAPADDSAAYRSALESITADDLKHHVQVLAADMFEGREAGTRGGRAATVYLHKAFASHPSVEPAGVQGTYFQPFQAGYRNVLGLIRGHDSELRDEIVLIGAHFDHVGYGSIENSKGPTGLIHNGADDNASGTSAVLETMEAFAQSGYTARRSILFALWDAEEKGLLGSRHWLENPTLPLEQLKTAVNLDMVGRLRQERLEIGGTRTSYGLRRLTSRATQGTNLTLDYTWELRRKSDHWPFFQRSIPVVHLHTGLHDDYHRPSDDTHKINAQGLEQVVRFLFQFVSQLADRETIGAFRNESRRESPATQAWRERPLPPLPPRMGISWDPADMSDRGVLVTRTFPGSSAEAGGIRIGDRILRFAGQPTHTHLELRSAVLAAGQGVHSVEVVKPGESEAKELFVDLQGDPIRLGFSWREDDAEPRSVMLTRVVPGSPADRAGLKVGDRIYRLDGSDIADSQSFGARLRAATHSLELVTERDGRRRTVHIVPHVIEATTE